jgi:hypothetical protein
MAGSRSITRRLDLVSENKQPLHVRAIAAWYSSGIEWGEERRVGTGDLPALTAVFRSIGVPGELAVIAEHAAGRSSSARCRRLRLSEGCRSTLSTRTPPSARARSTNSPARTEPCAKPWEPGATGSRSRITGHPSRYSTASGAPPPSLRPSEINIIRSRQWRSALFLSPWSPPEARDHHIAANTATVGAGRYPARPHIDRQPRRRGPRNDRSVWGPHERVTCMSTFRRPETNHLNRDRHANLQ